ncbi:glycosyltransferase [Vallitalea pronyensis]|uniref:Glycosyltransferase n=1 Tax=Vallitalea pronyensis TaxID=1348613 RepID=A0A8J8SJ09_9FIRM|nr:glycosyltransferase [Vallitalea pronyensis]QUI25002.1 glycosyltransferase [Vallitalea pronyensis]
MKKKLLVLGVLPTEMGGSYFSGVTTVIRDLTPHFLEYYNVAIFATNLNKTKIKNKHLMYKGNEKVKIFGYSILHLLVSLFIELVKNPIGLIKELKDYRNVYGMPAKKMLLYRLSLEKIIDEFSPDLIHSHGVIFLPILKYIDNDSKVVTTFHEIPFTNKAAVDFNRNKGIDIEKLYTKTAKLLGNFTCLNQDKYKQIEYLISKEINFEIIGNGINLDKFYFEDNSRNIVRKKNKINKDDNVFITVASLTKRKGHSLFLDYIARNNLNITYWIIGNGPEYDNLKEQICILKLEDQVKLLGVIPNNELYKYYSAADAFILPSSSEGQAMTILESLACGLPVYVNNKIYSTLEFSNELMKYVIPIKFKGANSINSLSEFNRKDIAKLMSQYSWEKVASKYRDFFDSI